MMNSILKRTTFFNSALGFTVILMLAFSLDAAVQSEEAKVQSRSATATMQVAAVGSKPMPSNTTFANICDPARTTRRQTGDSLSVECTPTTPPGAMRLTAKSGAQRSDINCKYTENDEGGLDVESCTCKADSESNCTNFITWCAKQGAEVGGNNQSATCGG